MLSLFLGLQMACTGSVASDVDTGSATVDSQESPVDSSTDTGELIDRDQDGLLPPKTAMTATPRSSLARPRSEES